MAEFLIKAEEPWNNDKDVSDMTAKELKSFNSRTRKGDIIVVRQDNWEWGKEECPPKFVVIKCPEMSIKESVKYEEGLNDENDVSIKTRKYNVSIEVVEECKLENKGVKSFSKLLFKNKLKEKAQ